MSRLKRRRRKPQTSAIWYCSERAEPDEGPHIRRWQSEVSHIRICLGVGVRVRLPTSFARSRRAPPTTAGRRTRWTVRGRQTAIKMAVGMRSRKIFSNLIVKSKLPRHPWTAGPIDSSLRHPEKSIVMVAARQEIFPWCGGRGEELVATIHLSKMSGTGNEMEVPQATGTNGMLATQLKATL